MGSSGVKMIGDYNDVKEVLNDPSVHYWVKDQYKAAMKKDILDALRDAELLVEMLEETFNESMKEVQ